MAITPEGIVRVLRFSFDMPLGSHAAVNVSGATPLKASFPMDVTLAGIVTVVKPVQPENALFPIVVTPEGISISCNEVHPAKRFSAIVSPSPVKVTRSNFV